MADHWGGAEGGQKRRVEGEMRMVNGGWVGGGGRGRRADADGGWQGGMCRGRGVDWQLYGIIC